MGCILAALEILLEAVDGLANRVVHGLSSLERLARILTGVRGLWALGKSKGIGGHCARRHWRRTLRSTRPLLLFTRMVPWVQSMADQGSIVTSPTRSPHRSMSRNMVRSRSESM